MGNITTMFILNIFYLCQSSVYLGVLLYVRIVWKFNFASFEVYSAKSLSLCIQVYSMCPLHNVYNNIYIIYYCIMLRCVQASSFQKFASFIHYITLWYDMMKVGGDGNRCFVHRCSFSCRFDIFAVETFFF